jgi:hypothetical protein
MNRIATLTVAVCCLFHLHDFFFERGSVGNPTMHVRRQAETDLEVGGDLAGLAPGSTRYIAYKDLLALPQVSYTVSDDVNFSKKKTQVSGIPLAQLASILGAGGDAKLVVAICYDGYRTNYPQSYLTAHRPLLVLRINGKTEADWPKSEYGGPLGPYLISSPTFTPTFKVLSHVDQQQIPFGVTRIEFRDERAVLGSIAPRGAYGADSPVMQGYRIAQQNCFRCHNMANEGGQMAGRDWLTLAMWASTEPKYFSRYVKNPQAIDSKNRMPGNPDYDDATIEALRLYFSAFAVGKAGGGP